METKKKNKIYKLSYLKKLKKVLLVLTDSKGKPRLYISPEVNNVIMLENGAIITPPRTRYFYNLED